MHDLDFVFIGTESELCTQLLRTFQERQRAPTEEYNFKTVPFETLPIPKCKQFAIVVHTTLIRFGSSAGDMYILTKMEVDFLYASACYLQLIHLPHVRGNMLV